MPLLIVRNRLPLWLHTTCWSVIILGLAMLGARNLWGLAHLVGGSLSYLYLLWRLKREPVALTVEEEGVRLTSPPAFLPWSAILGAGVTERNTFQSLGFHLYDREAVWAEIVAAGGSRRILTFSARFGYDLYLNGGPGLIDPPASEVAAFIQVELRERQIAASKE